MKITCIIFIYLAFNITNNAKSQTYCDFIHNIQRYQDSVKLISHYDDNCKTPQVDTTSFNVNTYLNMFNKLKLASGKICYLMNNYGSYSGRPSLFVMDTSFDDDQYVKEKIAKNNIFWDSIISQKIIEYNKDSLSEKMYNRLIKRYETLKKFYSLRENALRSFANDSVNKACNNLIPDDSLEGYLQYLFFNQMGEQFALFWHSYYGEKYVICNKNDIDYFLSYYKKRDEDFSYEEMKIQELSELDLSPIVKLGETVCKISWYEILTHAGIFFKTYTIERKKPFSVLKVNEQKIANINANFFY